jgi:hypothetical protein
MGSLKSVAVCAMSGFPGSASFELVMSELAAMAFNGLLPSMPRVSLPFLPCVVSYGLMGLDSSSPSASGYCIIGMSPEPVSATVFLERELTILPDC